MTRNQFAFHYSPKKYDRVLPQIEEELKFYIQDGGRANNLYYFAEILANMALLHEIPGRNGKAAMKRLTSDIIKITNHFVVGCDALINAIIGLQAPEVWKGIATSVQLQNLKPFEQIRLPWFTDTKNLGKKAG